MSQLPFLVSIPHGGTVVPAELRSRIDLAPPELLADGDPYTGEIYDTHGDVEIQLKFDIARAIIDVNRASDDLPPANPDGVVKTVSIFKTPIYRKGQELSRADIAALLAAYYQPYHAALKSAVGTEGLWFALDCHSMEAIGPPVARDVGEKRPLFCLGTNNGMACSATVAEQFAKCLAQAFVVPRESITLDAPFAGGYITRRYGRQPLQWLQVEMNRKLYLAQPWYQSGTQCMDSSRLQELNRAFRRTLQLFWAEMEQHRSLFIPQGA